MSFADFFKAATEHAPYDYQCRLACGDDAHSEEPETLTPGRECRSKLINISTGLGKTAAVALAWLWNRVQVQNPKWPRRLVYCLPMGTLVEQTEKNVREWLENLSLTDAVGVHVLMGGEETGDWDLYPERDAVLIGTQDMLLSRALNRGYGMSCYRWPMHFGLLNNDCLWVLDETQLMGVGVETSAQLDGFRHLAEWAKTENCPTWWMSATLDSARLATVDHPEPEGGWEKITLSDSEHAADGVRERVEARKPVRKAGFVLSHATKDYHAMELATLIAAKHVPGTLTLVVVNRVPRARKLYEAVLRDDKLGRDPTRIALIHSRFRSVDRARHTSLLFGEGDRIVIATQAVEAGVDVSARLLITELAPWSSLVQRFGRCNRRGDLNNTAEIIWIDIQPKDDRDDLLLPYSADDLKKVRDAIARLADAGPQTLGSVHVSETPVARPVLRRRDLVDLFDTTPDLCGQDLDISRYIRDGEDTDVQFFWRDLLEKSTPSADEGQPRRDELCRVSIGEAKKFIDKKSTRVWQWNSLAEEWQKAEHARPGALYLIDIVSGGYDNSLGWTGDPKSQPTPLQPPDDDADAQGKDGQTYDRDWLLLEKHTENVVAVTAGIVASLSLESTLTNVFRYSAQWHDAGKAHNEFQAALRRGPYQPDDTEALYAKSKNPYNPKAMREERRGFRHELASALAWLAAGPANAPERDLVAYLIAAHHGKVRLSIRSLPDEKGDKDNPDRLFARGVWHRDELPAIPGLTEQPVTLDLRLMQMGDGEHGRSWLARMISLRAGLGPFRLAFLETLLRAADSRASASETTSNDHSSDGVPQIMQLCEAQPPNPAKPPSLSPNEQALVADLVADGLAIQDKFRPEPLYKETGKGHYASDTVEEIRRAKESKPKEDGQ